MDMSNTQNNYTREYLWKTGVTRVQIHKNRYLNSKLSHLGISDVLGNIIIITGVLYSAFPTMLKALYIYISCTNMF